VAVVRRVNIFDTATEAVKEAFKLTVSLLPFIAAVFICVYLMRESGLTALISHTVAPVFSLVKIPTEVAELIILRPLSGNGSLVVLENLYTEYGADSYIARVASVIMASTDTILYVTAVYFSPVVEKKNGKAIAISFAAFLFGIVLSALFCSIF
jgi:spore maturation protein B